MTAAGGSMTTATSSFPMTDEQRGSGSRCSAVMMMMSPVHRR
ncbi:hypothetical protein HanPI659440_Chr04g0160651 [Helianthus annuus]|nr:hypothetical protein HanPI659440_Chr04g0160651 [Helianthus annuus]